MPLPDNREAEARPAPALRRDGGSQTGRPVWRHFPKRQRFSLPLWHTSVSVSISAVCGRADCWKAPGVRRPFSESRRLPGRLVLSVPISPRFGPSAPGNGVSHSGSAPWPRPRRQALIYGLPPRLHFPVPPHGFCCGRKTMLRYAPPGKPFLPVPGAFSPPVWLRISQAFPGPFLTFVLPGQPYPVPFLVGQVPRQSGFCWPVPRKFWFLRRGCPPLSARIPPAVSGPKALLFGSFHGICRFWTSGDSGPKLPRRPRPQTEGGWKCRKPLFWYPKKRLPRYPAVLVFGNSAYQVSFRWRIPPFTPRAILAQKFLIPVFPLSFCPPGVWS